MGNIADEFKMTPFQYSLLEKLDKLNSTLEKLSEKVY